MTAGGRYVCEWCGAEVGGGVCPWSIACPGCGAAPGARCKRPSGHDAADMHSVRYLTAEAMGEPRRQRSLFDCTINEDGEGDACTSSS